MPVFIPIIAVVWLLVIAVALLLCVAARRTDDELTRTELAPVLDITEGSPSRRDVA